MTQQEASQLSERQKRKNQQKKGLRKRCREVGGDCELPARANRKCSRGHLAIRGHGKVHRLGCLILQELPDSSVDN